MGHAQIGLLKGFNSKFPTSIPIPFICGVPPPGREFVSLSCLSGWRFFSPTFAEEILVYYILADLENKVRQLWWPNVLQPNPTLCLPLQQTSASPRRALGHAKFPASFLSKKCLDIKVLVSSLASLGFYVIWLIWSKLSGQTGCTAFTTKTKQLKRSLFSHYCWFSVSRHSK